MSDLRDISIDELFSWRENTSVNARMYLGSRGVCNQSTYDEIKHRCGRVEIVTDWMKTFSLSNFEITVDESVPGDIIRPRKLIQPLSQ
jgi:hypothetical protein